MRKLAKNKCHADHTNQRWWIRRGSKQTCCCCGEEMPEKPNPMTRQEMQDIANNISDIYPGKKIVVLMPGDEIPTELKPKKK